MTPLQIELLKVVSIVILTFISATLGLEFGRYFFSDKHVADLLIPLTFVAIQNVIIMFFLLGKHKYYKTN